MASDVLAQYLVVGLAVVLSALHVLRRQAPGLVRRVRVALAVRLLRDGRGAWMRALGRRIAPPPSAGGAECGACNGCDPAPASPRR